MTDMDAESIPQVEVVTCLLNELLLYKSESTSIGYQVRRDLGVQGNDQAYASLQIKT